MENILPFIPAWIMLTLGVVLLGIELLIGTFIILFFGLSFIIIGGSGFFIEWQSGEFQILAVMVLGAILTYSLRPLFMNGSPKEDLSLETMEVGELGRIVDDGGQLRLAYKGTTWAYQNTGDADIAVGDEVMVEALKNNTALIQKLP
ncbi:MAG: NfeD family protein [Gammaproteobacteria bacterium]|nr:NfeD family protein [Gammaproteobacteria bacterium]